MTRPETRDHAHMSQLAELSPIVAARDIPCGTRLIPRDATGTIVFVHGDGAAYEVEFTDPFHALVCVEEGDLAPR